MRALIAATAISTIVVMAFTSHFVPLEGGAAFADGVLEAALGLGPKYQTANKVPNILTDFDLDQDITLFTFKLWISLLLGQVHKHMRH